MPGRRWSDGLHQAVEAKEKVKIERENQTLATITFQNYFRKYKKLSGMTGTAETEAEEFAQDLQPRRDGHPAQPAAAAGRGAGPRLPHRAREVRRDRRRHHREAGGRAGRSLVGTVSIEKSERLSTMLQAARHQARRAEREVPRAGSRDRRAGRPQGRGHDRHQHGGPRHRHPARRQRRVHGAPAVPRRGDSPSGCRRARSGSSTTSEFVYFFHLDGFYRVPRSRLGAHLRALQAADATPSTRRSSALGGLHIVGTERHEARRIDNQLRGRAGRQGDPGLVALLPLARRRPDAHLRVRPHLGPDAAARAWKRACRSSTGW